MFEVFETYIQAMGNFTRDDLQLMRSLSSGKKVRRRQHLLQEGEVSQHKIFIAKGLLRTYVRREDGAEYIMRFAPENNWAADYESFTHQTPAKANIDALEDTEVILWTRENFGALSASIPAFKSFLDEFLASNLRAGYDRIRMNISATAEEKYRDFITSHPDVFRRVPLHMVASYLGVSRETLSRVRHAQVKQGRG